MLNTTQENVKDYSIIAGFITLISLCIRPFISLKQTIEESCITFTVSMCSGLILSGVDIAQPIQFGLAGVIGLLAVRIYTILDKLLHTAEIDPLDFLKQIFINKKNNE